MTATKNQEYNRNSEEESVVTLSAATAEPTSGTVVNNRNEFRENTISREDSASTSPSNPGDSNDNNESQKKGYDKDKDVDINTDNSIDNDNISDPLRGLERFLTNDTTRLNLKWEHSVVFSNNSNSNRKIIVGTNNYLPLGGRGCFSLEIPPRKTLQSPSPSPKERQQHGASARELLFRLVSKIVILSPYIRELDLEGFGNSNSNHHRGFDPALEASQGNNNSTNATTTLDIEDVFEAFAREESSPWRSGFLVVLRTWDCDMNSHYGNNCFELAEREYPEGLEEVYVHNPKESILSSSIFKIASRAKKLNRFYVFDGCDRADDDGTDNNDAAVTNNNRGPGRRTNSNNPHRFNGSMLTQSSIDTIYEVFSSTNQLLEMNQLPFRELLQLREAEFCRILEATTISSRKTTAVPRVPGPRGGSINLRFPIALPRMHSGLSILATRSEALRFYLLWKRSLEVLRNPQKKGICPLVLEKCQKRKSTKQWIPCNQIDLLFAMLQDSLEGILDAPARVGWGGRLRQLRQKGE
jgi:hypothetical protein